MKKISMSMILTLALLVLTAGTVFAQDAIPPYTGTVQTITFDTDSTTGQITVLLTVTNGTGNTQTLRLSLETAASLGLVSTDTGTGETTINAAAAGMTITIDPATMITDPIDEVNQHPVGSALSDFFGELLGVDYETVMSYHDEGVGFGVIAQALWMTKSLDGDSSIFQAILDAKKNGDYSAVILPDGSNPTNWGQFRKAVLGDREKAKTNLGSVMSGHTNNGNPTINSTNTRRDDRGNSHTDENKEKQRGKDKNKNK